MVNAMQHFLDACLSAAGCRRQEAILHRIVALPDVHARFLNTLSRLEYVGVRKMLKARRAEDLDLDGLQHILEEAVHALRLKRFAVNATDHVDLVRTFDAAHTLAGDSAEQYFQAVDRSAADVLPGHSQDVCYVMTSTAIEIRAQCFYPAYQRVLGEHGAAASMASIINDEQGHLQHMAARLPAVVDDWEARLASVMQTEERAFCAWLDAIEAQLPLLDRTPNANHQFETAHR